MEGWMPYAVLAGILILAVAVLYVVSRRRRRGLLREDGYTRGLELWLAGDLNGAVVAMREAISADPSSVDPYLQLGNLLRLTGDPRRAAVLHRGLTIRGDIEPEKRFSISLALADDLIATARWSEAGVILDALQKHSPAAPRFWEARFRQCLGAGDSAAAAKALQEAAKKAHPDSRGGFRKNWELFQLDRALLACRDGSPGQARKLLRGIDDKGVNAPRLAHARAVAAMTAGDYSEAVSQLTAGLIASPAQADLLLPVLTNALLESGHYERTIPILETACRSEGAPVSLWITLALLHDKVGDRELAVRLMEEKVGDSDLTPDAAAPLLRILVNDLPESDFTRVWHGLSIPAHSPQWVCGTCGRRHRDVRWFCPDCRSFGAVVPVPSV